MHICCIFIGKKDGKKKKPKAVGGGGDDDDDDGDEDPETKKLQAALSNAIVTETPNVKVMLFLPLQNSTPFLVCCLVCVVLSVDSLVPGVRVCSGAMSQDWKGQKLF